MKVAKIQSPCECQAVLHAEINDAYEVLRGWASRRYDGELEEEISPANTTDKGSCFHVGWQCPFCIRNTLRAFDDSGLRWTEVAAPSPKKAS